MYLQGSWQEAALSVESCCPLGKGEPIPSPEGERKITLPILFHGVGRQLC